jgi:hypothetical protein
MPSRIAALKLDGRDWLLAFSCGLVGSQALPSSFICPRWCENPLNMLRRGDNFVCIHPLTIVM